MRNCEDEVRMLRERLAALEDLVDRLESDAPEGDACVVGTSFAQASYPAAAGSFFAFHRTTVLGTEAEGSTQDLTSGTGVIIAANIGTAVPPAGTAIPLDRVSHRWTFRYDG